VLDVMIKLFNAVSTKEVILGTENGQLHELYVDEKDKKEKYIKFLFELRELPEAFMGLQVYLFPVYCYRFFFQDNIYCFISFL